jgi:hypothetical protein
MDTTSLQRTSIEHQDAVVAAIVAQYASASSLPYKVTATPDKESNGLHRACDGFAECPGHVSLAIEHTTIPTFPDQLEKDAQFMRAVGLMEAELRNSFPYGLELWVRMDDIKKGQDWDAVRGNIRAYLLANISTIQTGSHIITIPDVPFSIRLDRIDEEPHLFFTGRSLDPDLDIANALEKNIEQALVDKNDQLKRYHEDGNRTLLVLDSLDIAFVNHVVLYRAFLKAYARVAPKYIDEVWLTRSYGTETEGFMILCFLADQDLMDRVNPPHFKLGPRYAAIWEKAED